jgi:8-oxo-dGTP diphosphatase
MMSCISVACIAYENGRIFVARRNPSGDMGGRWEFPGGKAEEGESDEQAIVREMIEEFGVTVTVCERIAESEFIHNGKVSQLHAYRIFLPYNGLEKKFILTEHSGYDWVEPQEIEKLLFVDSDMQLYPQVLAYIDSLKNGK